MSQRFDGLDVIRVGRRNLLQRRDGSFRLALGTLDLREGE